MTRLSLLGERGVCLCFLLGLPLSPLHVCTIEAGVEFCSGVGLWLLLSSSSTSSSECSPTVAGSVSAIAQATLCLHVGLDICLRSSRWLSFIRCWSCSISALALSVLQIARRTTHFPLFTPTPFPLSLTSQFNDCKFSFSWPFETFNPALNSWK